LAERGRLMRALRAAAQRLSVRVVASVLLAQVVLVAIGGFFVFAYLQHHLLDQVQAQVQTAAERMADDLDHRMRVRRRVLEAVAFDLNAQGARLDADAARAFLSARSDLLALFERVVIVDAAGRPLAARPQAAGWRDIDVSSRDYFRAARDTGRTALGEPVMGMLTRAPIVVLAVPLAGADGGFGGLMLGAMNLNEGGIFDHLRGATVGRSGHFTVFTRGGAILFDPDAARVMTRIGDGDATYGAALRGEYAARMVSDGPAAGMVAFKPLNHAPWIVGARMPRAEALALSDEALEASVVAVVVSLAVLAALTGLAVAYNLRPLVRLKQEIGEIEAGARTGAVSVAGAQEIRAVAQAFNRLQDGERTLRQTMAAREAFHRTLNENTPLGVFVADEGGDWHYANRRLEQIVGRRAEMLQGTGWLACIHPQDRAAMREQWNAALRGNRPLDTRWRLLVDGRTVWTQVHVQPLPEGAEVGGFVGALADVTGEVQALEQVERERERADGIVEAISDAIVVVDDDGRIAHFNAAAERLTGWPRRTALGLALNQALRFVDEAGNRVDLDALRRQASAASDEWSCETAAGGRIPVDVQWSAAAGGDIAGTAGGVLVLRDASARRDRARQLAWQARHDALTGLLNRRAFDEALAQRYEAFAFHGVNSALVLVDLDWFKRVNDEGGHDAGDEMLKKVADVLRGAVRDADIAARLGGDEFALILPGCPVARAQGIAQVVRAEIRALRVVRGEREFAIGASQGISAFAIGDEDAQAIVKRADAACYRAKAAGRNAIEIEDAAVNAVFELF
jgi:diguanylate cyclase (GGDEF)-like protein/PAS domain S-box-containing protein